MQDGRVPTIDGARRPARWRVIAAAIAAVSLVVAGCSTGGDEEIGAPTTSTTTPGTTVEPAPSAGCSGEAASVRAGVATTGLTVGDARRSYIRRVPPAHDGRRPVPVVVDLHGYGETAAVHVVHTELAEYGDGHGFVTVTPDGSGPVPHWELEVGSPDVEFIRQLLDEIERTMCVDTNRIYLTGLYAGGMLSIALTCTMADRIAAVASVEGPFDPQPCQPSRPVPALFLHGTADPYTPYEGGVGPRSEELPEPSGSTRSRAEVGLRGPPYPAPPVDDVVQRTAERNGCGGAPSEERIAPDVVRVVYPCARDASVELYRIEGGGHTWPGSAFSRSIPHIVGRTTESIAANNVIWTFFEDHPKLR